MVVTIVRQSDFDLFPKLVQYCQHIFWSWLLFSQFAASSSFRLLPDKEKLMVVLQIDAFLVTLLLPIIPVQETASC